MTMITIDQREVMRRMTLEVRVTGRRRARVRIWIAVRLLYLAARVLGTGMDIVIDCDNQP